MHRRIVLVAVALGVMALVAVASAAAAPPTNYRAVLSAGEEVQADPVESRARGVAKFQLSSDGTELSYRLIVANIENVAAAHIHLAPAGENGSVVAFLYGDGLIEGRTNGTLATGTITADDLIGPLAGMDLADLVAEIEAGNTYVNVHTAQYPAGEVRGQIR